MNLVLTFCAGILSAAPGCRETSVRLLAEVTPQQCIIHAQQKAASDAPLHDGRLSAYRCERRRG